MNPPGFYCKINSKNYAVLFAMLGSHTLFLTATLA